MFSNDVMFELDKGSEHDRVAHGLRGGTKLTLEILLAVFPKSKYIGESEKLKNRVDSDIAI